ncbi:MAG TPA: hypothetical protein VIS76_06245 [Pseudomonadales bacterium]
MNTFPCHGRVVFALLLATAAAVASVPVTADCSGARFNGSVPYALDESLPFDFHQPASWNALSESSSHQVVSVFNPAIEQSMDAIPVSIDVMVSLQQDRQPEMTEELWQQTMELIAEVHYADESLTIYSPGYAVMAKFLVPFDGLRYQVSVNFNNGEFCPEEAARLRDLFVDTLTPNDGSRFQPR